jgi:hypothetical protein
MCARVVRTECYAFRWIYRRATEVACLDPHGCGGCDGVVVVVVVVVDAKWSGVVNFSKNVGFGAKNVAQSQRSLTASSASRLPHFLPRRRHHSLQNILTTTYTPSTAPYPIPKSSQLILRCLRDLRRTENMSAWVWVVGLGATAFFVRLHPLPCCRTSADA